MDIESEYEIVTHANATRNEYTLPLNDKPQIVNGCFELFEIMTSRHQPDIDTSIFNCLSWMAIRMLLQKDKEQIAATINSQSKVKNTNANTYCTHSHYVTGQQL